MEAFEVKPFALNLLKVFHRYVFADNHFSYNTGFLVRTENNILYKQITDVNIQRNALQYLFGIGNVVVHTQQSRVREIVTLYDLVEFREIAKFLLNESSKKSFVDAM